jgi:hypothetical protein
VDRSSWTNLGDMQLNTQPEGALDNGGMPSPGEREREREKSY